ncbi:hypothetical protein TCAL_04160 [Tigriopus californicus]|uniref:Globin domain-containing protein n=1 Tax=Tigriopus californicus TaxID=6832 RepID=A0A553NS19_TIGCA|nr:uncharacterized protein LOC131888583 [Tigriopus californicus]XP_059093466.1 uncharacterized protein LOC131888583 [Tigriopus californicus]XP_059093474.1 uncharacterized protein LOC131888583 [Tigriopus californicus]TRY68236.1 hypothetical protein TCAL_04160 [Tigriopus californicus]|eukprot:TCALIF_04160-PA protein Name:"Similar to cygb1 Cytoglobin-1 (Danio rerio)" AED:0.00 eAED:0.00 QI:65/1/1/1/1/1/2/79/231
MLRRFIPTWMTGSPRKSDDISVGPGDNRLDASMVQEEKEEIPTVDVLSLSVEQKLLLKESWKIIYSEMGQALSFVGGGSQTKGGMSNSVADTFLKLFQEYPKSQEFFFHFRDTPVEALKEDVRLSRALQEHAVRVMQVVEKVIARLENADKSNQYLLNLGKFHRHAGIPNDYFGVMGTIFCHSVRPYLEDQNAWNENVEDVWMELFGHIARVMTHGHKYYHIATHVPPNIK